MLKGSVMYCATVLLSMFFLLLLRLYFVCSSVSDFTSFEGAKTCIRQLQKPEKATSNIAVCSESSCKIASGRESREDLKGLSFWSSIVQTLKSFKSYKTYELSKIFPSPHLELLLGLTLGINNLKNVPRFNDVSRSLGIMHVLVVSGFNINLLFNFFLRLLGGLYNRLSFSLALGLTLIYALLCGFEAPAVRAWFTVFLLSYLKSTGRSVSALYVILLSMFVMLILWPTYLLDASFHLSFLSSFGLLLFSGPIHQLLPPQYGGFTIMQDFISTLSAQLMVLPYALYFFHDINLFSIFYNSLLLWLVPLSTCLGLIIVFVPASLAPLLFYAVFPLLDIFVRACFLLYSTSSIGALTLTISLTEMLALYFFVFSLFYLYRLKSN